MTFQFVDFDVHTYLQVHLSKVITFIEVAQGAIFMEQDTDYGRPERK